jgi:hypothetical protein
LLVNLVAITFGALALHTQQSTGKGALTLALAGCMALLIYVTYALERRADQAVH